MPIYEYKCTICGEHFEVEQSIKANTLKTIKGDDHRHKVKKVFHAPGISFKGDGFYKNDARGKEKASSSASESAPKSSSEAAKKESSSESSSSTSDSSASTDTSKSSSSKSKSSSSKSKSKSTSS